MDYEFTFDDVGRPFAKFSMGAEAIGRWLSEELASDDQMLHQLLAIIEQLQQRIISHHQVAGVEFLLRMHQDEVEVIALVLDVDMDDELPEDTQLYDEESYAGCGLADFKQVLLSWHAFIN